MNELYNTTNAAAKIRKALLATASVIVLAAHSESAQASDADRPTVWIEGGWHFESVTGADDPFNPPLDAETRAIGFTSLTTLEKELGRTYGGEGSMSFQPNGSDWIFTASARYGRAQTTRRTLDQKAVVGSPMKNFDINAFATKTISPSYGAYAEGYARNSEAHLIADFQIGRDVGIGLLGRGTESVISFGARFAQMNAKSKVHSYANPDPKFEQLATYALGHRKYRVRTYFHQSQAFAERSNSLQALGPALSLKNTTGLLGTADDGELALDWGLNASLLFGRQKARTSHHSSVRYQGGIFGPPGTTDVHAPITHSRSRMVAVPNVGGFAGLSYRFPNAKISAGYRADFFFGAKDGGLETRHTVDVGFHGPFATISIGLGG